MNGVRELLLTRGLANPDGRPLYAYKWTDEEFLAISRELIAVLARSYSISRSSAPAFCLFAAERFSRGDGSDWYTWDGIKAALELAVPDQDLRDAVRVGLQFWRRDVLRGGRGNEYLATVVCEGGLPLALVRTEGSRLRRYFRDLLEDHETFPTLDLLKRARELHAPLPIRMQNTIVYELAAQLIREIARMRAARAPSADLAQLSLPLRIDDAAARELIEGLRTAPKVEVAFERGIVVRSLLQSGAEPLLRREIVLPPRLSPRWLKEATGIADAPPRLYISLESADGDRQTVGVATLQDDFYLVGSMASRSLVRPTTTTEQLRCVLSYGGDDIAWFVPRGGEAIPDTPWTFDDEIPDGRMRATGGWRCSAPTVLIALPRRGDIDVDGVVEDIGILRGYDRRVVRLRGELLWCDSSDAIHIVSGAHEDVETTFELRGRRPSSLVQEPDIWLGRPDIVEVTAHGIVRPVQAAEISWRTAGAAWSVDLRKALGAGELRVLRDGVEFRARVQILPEDFQILLLCGGGGAGQIEVRSNALEAAGATPSDRLQVSVTSVTGGFAVRVVAQENPAPATLRISLRMKPAGALSLTLPFPAEHAVFVSRDGTPLTRDAKLSVSELAHVRASVVSPLPGAWAVDVRHDLGTSCLARLRDRGHGARELSLGPLVPALLAILASHHELDHEVTLQLVREGVVERLPPSCRVRRYDAKLAPFTSDGRHGVALDREAVSRLGDEVVAALRAEAVPLRRPDRGAVALPRTQAGTWSTTDAGLDAGPWLVLAYQNDYLRTRPLRITVQGPIAVALDSELERAMAVADRETRWDRLEAALAGLGDDVSANEWAPLWAQLSTLGRYPAATFDVVRAATRYPRIAVLALLNAGPRQPLFWNGFEELPFLWETIPVSVWLDAVAAWTLGLKCRLPASVPVDTVILAAAPGIFGAPKLARFLECIHDGAFLTCSGIPEPAQRSVFQMRNAAMRQHCVTLLADEKSHLVARHVSGFWPAARPWEGTISTQELGPLTQGFAMQPSFQRLVLETPLQLAARAVAGDTSCELLRLRQVRDFDPEWFDLAYAVGLAFLLGRRFERREPPFHD